MLERRALQLAVCLGGIIPVSAGLMGVVMGAGFTGDGLSAAGDSHYRYLSGLLLAIGLSFWALVPGIEAAARPARLLTTLVVLGGLARLYALASVGWPSWPMMGGLVMELAVTPALCLWQARVATQARAASQETVRT
jgi:Domain of unknown function (DUF4345)